MPTFAMPTLPEGLEENSSNAEKSSYDNGTSSSSDEEAASFVRRPIPEPRSEDEELQGRQPGPSRALGFFDDDDDDEEEDEETFDDEEYDVRYDVEEDSEDSEDSTEAPPAGRVRR